MKHYNDKLTVFNIQDSYTSKIWARKLYEESQKDSLFNTFKHHSAPATFTKGDIKRWWDARMFNNKPAIFIPSPREEAKNRLSGWFAAEYDKKLLQELTKEDLPNVEPTSNTKQASYSRSCSS